MRFQCCLTLDLTASLAAPAAFGAQAVGVPISPFARSRWLSALAGGDAAPNSYFHGCRSSSS